MNYCNFCFVLFVSSFMCVAYVASAAQCNESIVQYTGNKEYNADQKEIIQKLNGIGKEKLLSGGFVRFLERMKSECSVDAEKVDDEEK